MSYFIIIRGPAGVGKTTIANALAKSLHGVHISLDETQKPYSLSSSYAGKRESVKYYLRFL